jgi:hypothetical protein
MVRKCFINTSKLTISHTFTFIMPMLTRLVIRCVQSTLLSGVGCSDVQGDSNFHIFSLLFDGTAQGDHNKTIFRVDFKQQSLKFATGTSQGSSTGTPTRRARDAGANA